MKPNPTPTRIYMHLEKNQNFPFLNLFPTFSFFSLFLFLLLPTPFYLLTSFFFFLLVFFFFHFFPSMFSSSPLIFPFFFYFSMICFSISPYLYLLFFFFEKKKLLLFLIAQKTMMNLNFSLLSFFIRVCQKTIYGFLLLVKLHCLDPPLSCNFTLLRHSTHHCAFDDDKLLVRT